MIGHCFVVASNRRRVSTSGSATTSARPTSMRSFSCGPVPSTQIRLQTISPGLLTPASVLPPNRKYIGGWRKPSAPFQPLTKWAGGAPPEISNTHTHWSVDRD